MIEDKASQSRIRNQGWNCSFLGLLCSSPLKRIPFSSIKWIIFHHWQQQPTRISTKIAQHLGVWGFFFVVICFSYRFIKFSICKTVHNSNWGLFLVFIQVWGLRNCLHLSNSSFHVQVSPSNCFVLLFLNIWDCAGINKKEQLCPFSPSSATVWDLDPTESLVSWEKQWFNLKLLN